MASSSLIIWLYWSCIVLMLPWQPASVLAPTTTSYNCTLLTLEADPKVAQAGSTVRLNCSLGSQSDLQRRPYMYNASNVQWFHNGSSLMPGVRIQNVEAAGTSQLILNGVRIEHGGRYSCCLNASCAEEACFASLDILIGWPPEKATDLRCTSNDLKIANCTWTRGGQHSNLPSKDVLKRKARKEWQLCNDEADAVCTATTCHLCCSEANMWHTYRVESSNVLATVYSNETIFNLDTETIPDPPTGVTVTNRSYSSLNVHWSTPPALAHHHTEEGALNLIGFCLQYKWEGSKTFTKIKADSTDYTINNLTHPYGLYQVKVGTFLKHTEKKKCWKFSKKVFGRTTEVAPVNSPGSFTCPVSLDQGVDQEDIQNVDLSWKAVPNEYKQNGEILGYQIVVHNQNVKHHVTEVAVGPNITSHRIQGLLTSRHYNISLQTRNSMGLSDPKWCSVPSISPGASLWPVFVSVPILCCLLVVLCMVWAKKKYKSSIRRWPAARLPTQFINNNITHARGLTLVREREVFDELPIKEQVHSDSSQDGGLILIGAHRGACGGRSQPVALELQGLGQVNAGSDTDSLSTISPGNKQLPSSRIRYPSSEASSPHSPLSVASGGSYMILKDPIHSHIREGLSPDDRDRQRMGSDPSPGLVVKDDVTGSASRFVWDEGIIDGRSLRLSIFTETGDHPLGSPTSSLNSPKKCPHCHSIIQGKRHAPNESQTDASVTGESRSPGWGLVPVAEEKDEKEETHEQRENPDVFFDWGEPSVMWESLPNIPRSDAARPKTEPLMDSKRGELNLAAGYCGMNQGGSEKVAKVERTAASDYCKMKSQIGVDESVKSPEGIDGSVWSQWPRDACHAEGFLSDQEPLLSPDSTVSLPIDYESLNYVSVCTDGSDEDMEEQEASSQLNTSKPLNDSDDLAKQRDNSSADCQAEGNGNPNHPSLAPPRKNDDSLVVSETGELSPSEGYCRMDQVGSKRATSEGESTPASDYCEMNPIGLNEFTETLKGNNKGNDWSQWNRDTGDGEVFPSEQDPLLSPGSSISSPLCEDGSLQGSSLLKDYESLNYISVCTDGSDEEEEEQQTSEATRSLHNSDASIMQRDSSQGIITSLEDRLAESDNRPSDVALSSDEGFEEQQKQVPVT
ncbi:uncharacterized protein LOC119728362 isoform X2 [Patiria miniata]|uniref:Uncharacterized protein n=1 Tax=Patiria miniata TaxID=46514 RepID=A0A913ZYV7_PATMI|nr:uncharacterized protein LOC119728362 isoform X2 [Patiria miniata]